MSRRSRKRCARCRYLYASYGRQAECAKCRAYTALILNRAACKAYYARRHGLGAFGAPRQVADAFREVAAKPVACKAPGGHGPPRDH